MKKFFTNALLAASAIAIPAIAETTLPENLDGFFRMTNQGFQEALTVRASYDLGGSIPSASNAGSVFRVKTGKMFNFAEEMGKLQQLLESGQITEEQYTQMFMNLMTVDSWKGGFFPLTELTGQGQDFIEIVNKFPDYADAAIENFLNNDAADIYKEYRSTLTLLCVFASDIIAPVDLETEDTFRNWAERYLTRWRQVADFSLYLHPIYTTPENEDDMTPTEPTGAYYVEFKTPPYVGNMEKAQIYINNILTENGALTDVETLDIWGSAKKYMLEEMARDYSVDSPEYKLADQILSPTLMNQLYIIGESEEGGINLLMLPDAFNTQEVNITADDLERCTWQFEEVTEQQPFAIVPQASITDNEGWFYTGFNSPFPFEMLSTGMEAYYATAVNGETDSPTLEKITGNIVPAETPVIIRSKSTNATDNKVMPLDEATEIFESNVLKGVIFSEANNHYGLLGKSTTGPLFNAFPEIIPANSIYYDGELSGINNIKNESTGKMYDILGREVKNPGKGIYIVNGQKIAR